MPNQELCFTPAVDLAARIRDREISPVEVVANALDRIEEVNDRLNCFCFVYPEEALARAKEAERAVLRGEALGRLHGVPIAFKDMTPTRGKRTTLGSRLYEDWIPDHDAVVVERLVRAGAIIVGKTTTSELAFSYFTETELWGATRNPWDLSRTPGGSSGGSGAAVAAGCVPLAEGSDMGGSVRLPAAFCGVVGLKPSFGRIPFDLFPSQFDTFCHFGPLARSVGDAALFLRLAQGPDDRDILSLPAAPEIPDPLPDDVRGLRLAFSVDLGYYAVDREVADNTLHAIDALRAEGAQIDPVELPWTKEINEAGWRHWNAYMAALLSDRFESERGRLSGPIVEAVEAGRSMAAVALKEVEFIRTQQWAALRPILEKYAALLCPTAPVAPPPLGTRESDYGTLDAEGRYRQCEMTFAFNMISPCPALSVPSGFTSQGLPTGLQIVGRRYDDAMVLRIGAALERALGWRETRPPI